MLTIQSIQSDINAIQKQLRETFDVVLLAALADKLDEAGRSGEAEIVRNDIPAILNYEEQELVVRRKEMKNNGMFAAAAANIRKIAKKLKVKCSVKTTRYGYIEVTVADKSVAGYWHFLDLIDRFDCGRFDSHHDETYFEPTPFNDVFGGCLGISIR